MTLSCVTWLIHTWHNSVIRDTTHWHTWHDSLTRWRDMTRWLADVWLDSFVWSTDVWHDWFTCDVDSFIRTFTCNMADSHVICMRITYWWVTWLIHTWRWLMYMHFRVWHGWFARDMTYLYAQTGTWKVDMTCSYAFSFSSVTWFIHTWHDSYKYDRMHSHMTWLIYMWHDTFIWDPTNPYAQSRRNQKWPTPLSTKCFRLEWMRLWVWRVMWHDSFTYASWLVCTWRDSFIWDITHSCVIWVMDV